VERIRALANATDSSQRLSAQVQRFLVDDPLFPLLDIPKFRIALYDPKG
jgi:hypothetical protein